MWYNLYLMSGIFGNFNYFSCPCVLHYENSKCLFKVFVFLLLTLPLQGSIGSILSFKDPFDNNI